MTKTIMLVHGAWLNPDCWEGFKTRYEAQGYTVHAPAWPYDDRSVQELRRAPHPELHKVGVKQIADHYEDKIRALPEAPIIMGHSFGGVITQVLADRGLGAAAVAIDPAPIAGVFVPPTTLISALPVFLAPFGWARTLTMSRKAFGARFAQTLSKQEADAAYERYVVPTPGRVYYDGLLGIGTKVQFDNPNRPPLLLIAGEKDLTAQHSMIKANYNKQTQAASTTGFKMFPGRSHWLCLDRGWEEVADYALEWAAKNAKSGNVASITRAA
jgi:pimeloyl-ACP methyl ester carboxylesterase